MVYRCNGLLVQRCTDIPLYCYTVILSMKKTTSYSPTQSIQLSSRGKGGFDFRMAYYEKGIAKKAFATDRFLQYQDYNIIWLKNGKGRFQVDFQTYEFKNDKIIFLTPNQYFYAEQGEFEIIQYSFQQHFFCVKEYNPQTLCNGVLFNHVYAVASIEIGEKENAYFSKINENIWNTFSNPFSADKKKIKELLSEFLSYAVQTWLTQSPFDPDMSIEETDLLFDFRRALEKHYSEKKKIAEYAAVIGVSEKKLQRLVKKRINKKLSELTAQRQLLKTQRQLYFTDKSVKEIAFDTGFDDPTYFNRFFKKNTNLTPAQFREKHGIEFSDNIIPELNKLINNHFKEEHSVSFYAKKMYLTSRTLSNMVKKVTNKTVSDFIKLRIIMEAKQLLYFSEKTIKEIGWELGFEEPSHFSNFFKSATNMSPEAFRLQLQSNEKSEQFINQINSQNWAALD